MRKVATTFDELVPSYLDDVRATLVELDEVVRSCLAGGQPVDLGRRLLRRHGATHRRVRRRRAAPATGEDPAWFLVGVARRTRTTTSIYVNAVEDGAYLLSRYADRLGKMTVGSRASASATSPTST